METKNRIPVMTLLLILIGVYFVALISAFFYRRRRSVVFLAGTIPFVVLPLVAGRIGRYLYFFTYLVVAVTIIGTRHLRTDATDRRMRQKLALILMTTCLVCGGIFYLFIPPSRYDRNVDKLSQAKNSLVALSTWDGEDIMTWLKAYFNGDAISYGKIGKKSEVSYTGETMLKIPRTTISTKKTLSSSPIINYLIYRHRLDRDNRIKYTINTPSLLFFHFYIPNRPYIFT